MLDALASFGDNREALAKDAASNAALVELEGIRSNKSPYAKVNRIEGLLSTVESVNEGLAGERREKALISIDGKITEATQALDAASADANLRNAALKPLQDIKTQLAGLVSIPRILFLQGRGGELLDEAMDKIAAAAKATQTSKPASTEAGTPPTAPPTAVAKPIKVIRTADFGSKTYLETTQDVNDYVEKLKAALLSAIESGQRARVQ